MPARDRYGAVSKALILLSLVLTPAALGSPAPPVEPSDPAAPLDQWASGPVRWLLLPAELKQLRQIAGPAAGKGFVDRFWARRDPDPATTANPFRDTFYERVEAADLLYAEEGVRGSLTDRGRALILLGSPTGLRVTSREALSWDPSAGAEDNVRIRYLPLEIWTYRLEDFGRPLRLALMAQGDDREFRVSFVRDVDRVSLSEGVELLDLAARTALALGPE